MVKYTHNLLPTTSLNLFWLNSIISIFRFQKSQKWKKNEKLAKINAILKMIEYFSCQIDSKNGIYAKSYSVWHHPTSLVRPSGWVRAVELSSSGGWVRPHDISVVYAARARHRPAHVAAPHRTCARAYFITPEACARTRQKTTFVWPAMPIIAVLCLLLALLCRLVALKLWLV